MEHGHPEPVRHGSRGSGSKLTGQFVYATLITTLASFAAIAVPQNAEDVAKRPYLKSSGETWFIQSLNLSTTSSSGVSSIASSNTTPASSITSSEAKISAPDLIARAMASDGLESTSTVLPSISSLIVAKNVESLSSVTVILSI